MKRILLLIPILVAFVACNNNYQQPSNDFASTLSESSTPHYSSPKDAAPEIARTFVKRKFSSNCNFEKDVVLENTMVSNRYQVMQKFKSNGQEYVYKIFIQYFDGDMNDVSNWEFNQLIVENVDSGKQDFFKGDLDNRIKKAVGIGSTVEFAGIEFKITDARIGTAIKFSHSGTLSRKQLANAFKEMHDTYGYEFYHICKSSNPTEEYISFNSKAPLITDYEKNKIYESLDDFEKGKSLI